MIIDIPINANLLLIITYKTAVFSNGGQVRLS